MALRKVRLQSWDPEANTSLDEYDIPEGGLREIEHAGRTFRASHVQLPRLAEAVEDGTLVYTDVTPKR